MKPSIGKPSPRYSLEGRNKVGRILAETIARSLNLTCVRGSRKGVSFTRFYFEDEIVFRQVCNAIPNEKFQFVKLTYIGEDGKEITPDPPPRVH